jgi:hypothetical protein
MDLTGAAAQGKLQRLQRWQLRRARANLPGIVAVRDSKRQPLVFTVPEWDAFIRSAKHSEFDAESGDSLAP